MNKTTIVVLDGYALNPGDLSWQGLEQLGTCSVYDRTDVTDITRRALPADIILTNKTPLSHETIALLPNLRYIGVLATGYNVVDAQAARQRGIPVTNVPTYGTSSVAQLTVAHLLNLTSHVGHHANTVREGRWSTSREWCYWDIPLVELRGFTMGIIGLGRIGRATAEIARALGMGVIAYDIVPPSVPLAGITLCGLDEVFRRSDVVSLHCPLTPDTRALINRGTLALMKPSAFLINTSRGLLVDEEALAAALNEGRLAGAGLDVLSSEPPDPRNPLLHARNCHITPHLAWATRAARDRLLEIAVENVRAFLSGHPTNVVNL